jgi:hypothetical protein
MKIRDVQPRDLHSEPYLVQKTLGHSISGFHRFVVGSAKRLENYTYIGE